MKILVDADACAVIPQIESVARWHKVPVTLYCDTHHLLQSDYCDIKIVGAGKDAVDYELVKSCQPGDVVVTQDHGTAAMALSKKARVMHQDGWQYTGNGVDRLLARRRMFRGLCLSPHAHRRTEDDDADFMMNFDKLLAEAIEENDDQAYMLWWASSNMNHSMNDNSARHLQRRNTGDYVS